MRECFNIINIFPRIFEPRISLVNVLLVHISLEIGMQSKFFHFMALIKLRPTFSLLCDKLPC